MFIQSTFSPVKFTSAKRNPLFIFHITGTVLNLVTLIVIMVTAIRVIKGIRSSTLSVGVPLYRRQENKLMWLTYNVGVVAVACWVLQFISINLLASGVYGDTVINTLVIATNVGNYQYVLNPLVYYGIVKEKAGGEATNRRGRLPR